MSGWIYVFMFFTVLLWALWFFVKAINSAEQAEHIRRVWQVGRDAHLGQRAKIDSRDLFEITGTIRWFDAAKGYGFIATDAGMRDVLLPLACLKASGYQTAHRGARIHCEASRRRGVFQAFRVLSMAAANEP
jgi:cold shock CspA family protein